MRRLMTALATLAAAAGARAGEIDNPEYKGWAGCKPGALVRIQMDTDTAGQKIQMEMTHKLAEMTAGKAVIETTTVMKVSGQTIEQPPQKRDVPAKIEEVKAPEGAANAAKPEEGDEEIEVGGKKMKCHWIKTTTDVSGTKAHSKIWQCPEIPGGMAKMETTMEGAAAGSTTMTVVEFKK